MTPPRSVLSVSHRSRNSYHPHSLDSSYTTPTSAAPPFALPMSIPGTRLSVPPPLPPPNHLPDLTPGHDPGWQWSNEPHHMHFNAHSSVRPGSSLLGGSHNQKGLPSSSSSSSSPTDNHAHRSLHVQAERGSGLGMFGREHAAQEGRMSSCDDPMTASTANVNYRLHSERQLEQRALEASSQTYDKHLLSRIGGPKAGKHATTPQSLPGQDSNGEFSRRDLSQLKPLTLPERRMKRADSPRSARWASASSGADSPNFTPQSWPTEHGPMTPHVDSTANVTSATANARSSALHYVGTGASGDDMVSHRGSYEHSIFPPDEFTDDDRQPSSANPQNERYPPASEESYMHQKAGVKRRASSPARDALREDRSSVSSISGLSDAGQRRSTQFFPGHVSPGVRAHPNHSSVSSASSCGFRHGSLGSSLGPASMVSSVTSMASERISPSSMASSTRTFFDDRHGVGTGTTEGCISPRQNNMARVHGIFMCECCPKKPKKFDTEEELRIHESEKQYTCAYCPNRFKNKNEAERHQNSLHLRRHSWSCAALSTVEAAFHASPSGHEADLCGFCGEEFSNPPQWDVRAEHLNHVHKFGECNQSKKFFRADHFRQHLKHSHAGTSGKWTNMLENSCMKEEPLPEKRATSMSTMASTAPPRPLNSTMLSAPCGINGSFPSHIHHLDPTGR